MRNGVQTAYIAGLPWFDQDLVFHVYRLLHANGQAVAGDSADVHGL